MRGERPAVVVASWCALLLATAAIQAAGTHGPLAASAVTVGAFARPFAPSQAAPPAPVPVKPADAAPYLGTWEIPLDTPRGPVVATLVLKVEAGKVVAGLSSAQLPEERITDITKSGDVLTLKASKDYHGPLSSYQGLVTMVLTLTPAGKDLSAFFDFNYSTVQLPGTATRKN